MERVDSEYAALLHQLPFNPYSQYCYWNGDNLVWRVSTLTSEANSHIIEPIRGLSCVDVRAVHTNFEVVQSLQDTLSLKVLLDMAREPGPSRMRVQFLTPTAFKSKGEYVIMPSVRLMIQNLLMHYGQVYDDNKEGFEETIEYIDQQTRITGYNLRSCSFGHTGAKGGVPSFLGTMTLNSRGPEMTAGLVRMLLKFGEYAGIGIKTCMGMGGIKCIE